MIRRLKQRVAFDGVCAALGLSTALLAAGAARADQVTSKGTVLHGTITALNGAGISFAPEYGKGSIDIKWEDIEDLKTDGNFQVLYGEDEETDTPLQGFSNNTLFTGASLEGATQIDIKTIHSGVAMGPSGPSWRDRVRSNFRYWDGNLDLGFNAQQATTDTVGLTLDFKTTRSKGPTRLIFGATYRYGTQTPKNGNKTTTQDQWYGLIRGEYDLTARLYAFGSGEATYDAIQHLSIRGIPKAGIGYTFWEEVLNPDQRNFLAGEAGPAWVYERYFGGSTNDYWAVAFALVAGYYLPYGAHFDGRIDYLPSVSDFTNDYLLRAAAAVTMPLVDPISAKFSVLNEYDNTPAPNTDRNSLFITAGLSVAW
jgi:putative salt-induced outer membrane protein YdiY